MYLPQILVIGLSVFSLALAIKTHGEDPEPANAISAAFFTAIRTGLLIWGGFFVMMGWAQVTYIIITSVALVLIFIVHGAVSENPGQQPEH
jgi:hypothetical protein